MVRWSAAKGIGRVSSRLTSVLSEEVLSSVLELFSPGEVIIMDIWQHGLHVVESNYNSHYLADYYCDFHDLQGDGSWHGGCLALAELARRGLLLPRSFPQVVPIIVKVVLYTMHMIDV